MSEHIAEYKTSSVPLTREAFYGRSCLLPFDSGEYVSPTPQEIKALRNIMCWSQNDLAKIVGVKWDKKKGSQTVRKWETESGKKEHREISYAAWRLMLLHSGIVEIEQSV